MKVIIVFQEILNCMFEQDFFNSKAFLNKYDLVKTDFLNLELSMLAESVDFIDEHFSIKDKIMSQKRSLQNE